MSERRKVNFHNRCVQLKRHSMRRQSSIYSEYSQIKFGEYWRAYEASVKEMKEKGSSEMIQTHKAEVIAFGSLSLIQEFEKACSTVNRRKEFQELLVYSRKLAQEKCIKKVQISSLISFIRRVGPILKNRSA